MLYRVIFSRVYYRLEGKIFGQQVRVRIKVGEIKNT